MGIFRCKLCFFIIFVIKWSFWTFTAMEGEGGRLAHPTHSPCVRACQ